MAFEIATSKVGVLLEALRQTGLRLTPESESQVAAVVGDVGVGGPRPSEDVAGYLQITFVHGEPDLRREVPSIPG